MSVESENKADGGHDVQVQTTVDDVTGEVLGYTMDRLLEAGSSDVTFTPVTMKKGRPGVTVTVLCAGSLLDRVCDILIAELGTLGVRWWPVHRRKVERRFEEVSVMGERITLKTGIENGREVISKLEYEDACKVARKLNIPLRQVLKEGML
ncbi:MAG: DUF111 family protein [Candidatus Undinarchaeales archaeon]|jgi:hypothetical protein|nr:DUF111 family protein [Candidatus Undinarchaeales archaeon]MDP7493590.1 DUF111 family protein [Candidatus Undinarchaeales archaeon]